ncbi:aquaporin [Paraburkholderia caballeronis]|uniref:Aquaporin Z n=1 Tax=Paraburkholderia caballeronis TaxID=416943 RepID=A0A1H7HZE7_9BURK|nr:aquaporin [Paraburkholderia caballeronis]PXW29290.1 MIP family channel protein [Paraburkholderia caballeronis]PXX04549.1 MIP family channel protein [Paraburkholderia caballeronis]RAK05610.1 MIP family channel protein [Paraburkholderia caballeronis]SEC95512.1 aquaporin Z [Paraburkholderia caballeronis]SEK55661.1 aquaporin Z [Paraburkholderia caballeronis]
MKLGRRLLVECVGTGWLVFAGCAGAALNAGIPVQGWNLLGTPVAFGLALLAANLVAARAASAHFNPAVTIGYTVARRFPVRDVAPYLAAQTAGAILGAALLVWIASGRPGFSLSISEFGVNGYDAHSPSDYSLSSAFVIELAMTLAFVTTHLVMSGTPDRRRVAAIATGACFATIYLITMPVTNGAINPARSTGPALFVGGWALDQLWLFWAAPMLGGIGAGLCHAALAARAGRVRPVTAEPGGSA